MSNVVEVIVVDRNLTTMSKSIQAAGLDEKLSQKGPFTIFAPTNIAFGKLQAIKMNDLLKTENKESLITFLNHHVIDGITNYKDLKDNQKLVTTNGRELTVKFVSGKVTINNAVLQGRDSIGSNGIVHSLDTVIQFD
ncbi:MULTISPECIES: fasciclin domain-containing protein [unclassified Chitinophaga]|uniref:fasciclin domain-containing protein n=1 Tax=unclassified Chitinophaga TaxID=2619133 RepID=UPI0009FB0897|nr:MULTISPECIES: fasciclin domain-containing protein [unclassified Chitinophaga]WPV66140.1 fasciclin domain-containing protein [Chitinophaga sp. LS1]